ncbi:hypothetical protein AMTR_s00017p00255710 [Amborella trichopoda]|uniref:Uncharacterized protein n=1 Tax=Amborella trichopoda TaxID=13333 RepID=W1PNQ4_AMBTC|nr:hypothetical protein AMTR_s00017p00255710 [Amborella trichopoda]
MARVSEEVGFRQVGGEAHKTICFSRHSFSLDSGMRIRASLSSSFNGLSFFFFFWTQQRALHIFSFRDRKTFNRKNPLLLLGRKLQEGAAILNPPLFLAAIVARISEGVGFSSQLGVKLTKLLAFLTFSKWKQCILPCLVV